MERERGRGVEKQVERREAGIERERVGEICIQFQWNCFVLLSFPAYITSEDVLGFSNDLYIISAVLQHTSRRGRGKTHPEDIVVAYTLGPRGGMEGRRLFSSRISTTLECNKRRHFLVSYFFIVPGIFFYRRR